jgi:hypothetical protein
MFGKLGHYEIANCLAMDDMGKVTPIRFTAAIVLVASVMVGAAAQDNVSASDQTRMIEKARGVALQYTANLPNFITSETIQRSELPKHSQTWKPNDILTVDVPFRTKASDTTFLPSMESPPRRPSVNSGVPGPTANLEPYFGGSSSPNLQQSSTGNDSKNCVGVEHWCTLTASNRTTRNLKLITRLSFGGLVYVDRETNRVLKLSAVTSGFPASWRLTSFSQEIDYGFAKIGGQQFFLPLHAQTKGTMQDGSEVRNMMDFGNFRKFSSEATLRFEP